jgi:hypothetical protein
VIPWLEEIAQKTISQSVISQSSVSQSSVNNDTKTKIANDSKSVLHKLVELNDEIWSMSMHMPSTVNMSMDQAQLGNAITQKINKLQECKEKHDSFTHSLCQSGATGYYYRLINQTNHENAKLLSSHERYIDNIVYKHAKNKTV